MCYQNPAMDTLIDAARFAAANNDRRTTRASRASSTWRFEEVPRIPLFQPLLDVAMQKNIGGYQLLVPPPARLPRAAKG